MIFCAATDVNGKSFSGHFLITSLPTKARNLSPYKSRFFLYILNNAARISERSLNLFLIFLILIFSDAISPFIKSAGTILFSSNLLETQSLLNFLIFSFPINLINN